MTDAPLDFWCPRCKRAGQAQHGDRPWCEACQAEGGDPRSYNKRRLRRRLRRAEAPERAGEEGH